MRNTLCEFLTVFAAVAKCLQAAVWLVAHENKEGRNETHSYPDFKIQYEKQLKLFQLYQILSSWCKHVISLRRRSPCT